MKWLGAQWARHSLSIVMCGVGFACYAAGLTIGILRVSDFFLNLGHAFFPLGVFGFWSGPLRETNKPEK